MRPRLGDVIISRFRRPMLEFVEDAADGFHDMMIAACIAIPPDWVGHTFHSGLGFETLDFEVGVTTNYEKVFDIVTQDWPGGKGGSYIEVLLMTHTGLEVLSKLDRRMIIV